MKKRQLTISSTKDLRNFVKRTDVSIKSAFEVAETFLNVREPEIDENVSFLFAITVIGGNDEPNFTKVDIINWIDDYDKDPFDCKAIFYFS
jgi:hypothetical protein